MCHFGFNLMVLSPAGMMMFLAGIHKPLFRIFALGCYSPSTECLHRTCAASCIFGRNFTSLWKFRCILGAHLGVNMDLRKLKTLIDLVSESNVSELEITEAEARSASSRARPPAPWPWWPGLRPRWRSAVPCCGTGCRSRGGTGSRGRGGQGMWSSLPW